MSVYAPVPLLLMAPLAVHLFKLVERPRDNETPRSVDWVYGMWFANFACTLAAIWAFMSFCVGPEDLGRVFNPEWKEHIYMCGTLLAAAQALQWEDERKSAGTSAVRLD